MVKKRIVSIVSVMFLFVFSSMSVFAADAAPISDTTTSDISPLAVDVPPKVDMQQISIYPTYLDSNGNTVVGETGYTYNRSGNNRQAIFCTVTAGQKAKMDQSILDKGQTQVGYEITVYYTMTGTFKQGIVVTRKPTNMPRTSVISGWQANTVFFTDIASPDFVWDAYFSYIYNNNLLTQLMSAGVDFES